ncbi:hypothetical protein SODG_006888 [Sodalis praecaptivus]
MAPSLALVAAQRGRAMARCLPAVNGLYRGRRADQQLGLYGFTALRLYGQLYTWP